MLIRPKSELPHFGQILFEFKESISSPVEASIHHVLLEIKNGAKGFLVRGK